MTGAAGMLGRRVVRDAQERAWDVTGIDRTTVDLVDELRVAELVADVAPEAVVHCAAWTDVDGAEENEQGALEANAVACANIGAAARKASARVVAVSTDYVFDGTLTGRPYRESDPVGPIGAYGRTKLAGERALAAELEDHAIARTAWLYGWPGKSFPDTMLRLGCERDEVTVVTDEVGSPTWTGHLSPALLDLAAGDATGVFHVASAGRCSWNELTKELFRQAGVRCDVKATTAAAFGRRAPRPAWSVLASERPDAPALPEWTQGITGYLKEREVQA